MSDTPDKSADLNAGFEVALDPVDVGLPAFPENSRKFSEEYSWGHPQLLTVISQLCDLDGAVVTGFRATGRGLTVFISQAPPLPPAAPK